MGIVGGVTESAKVLGVVGALCLGYLVALLLNMRMERQERKEMRAEHTKQLGAVTQTLVAPLKELTTSVDELVEEVREDRAYRKGRENGVAGP